MTKTDYLPKLARFLEAAGLARVYADAVEKTARLALASLAGVPSYDQLWAGDLHNAVQIVAVASGERVTGVDFARRAQILRERAKGLAPKVGGDVQVLQLALYDRAVPSQERDFVVQKARVRPFWPLAKGRVATWIAALSEPAVYASRFGGWPQELSADQLRALFAAS
jgi:hypothetical protein